MLHIILNIILTPFLSPNQNWLNQATIVVSTFTRANRQSIKGRQFLRILKILFDHLNELRR